MSEPFFLGGSLPEDAATYVTRAADQQLYAGLWSGKFCYVLNSRQMGKSSLGVRTKAQLQADGVACAWIDLSVDTKATAEQWYAGILVGTLIDDLGLDVDLEDWWTEQPPSSPQRRWQRFLETVVLAQLTQPVVIFIDEIDSVLSLSFPTDDFFTFIRACYNQRADNPTYARLTFCLLGVASPNDLIADKQRTPFNIGEAIALKGFAPHEVGPLQAGLAGRVGHPQAVMAEILAWTGGQPFLTQKLCQLVSQSAHGGQPDVATVVRSQIIDHWEVRDEPVHLGTIRDRLCQNDQYAGRMLGLYQQILAEGAIARVSGDLAQQQLQLTNLVVRDDRHLRVCNPIYAQVFDAAWVEAALVDLRPYAENIKAWEASERQDQAVLLRGDTLKEARAWAEGKRLSDRDYHFLAASQTLAREEVEQALAVEAEAKHRLERALAVEAEAKHRLERALAVEAEAKQKLEQANIKAKRRLWFSIGLSSVVILAAAITIVSADQQVKRSKMNADVLDDVVKTDDLFASHSQIQAILKGIDNGVQVQNAGATIDPRIKRRAELALRQGVYDVRERNRLEGHHDAVLGVSFSPDGEWIASASADGTVKLWDRRGQLIHTLTDHQGRVRSVSFRPDGQRLASASDDKTVKLWDRQGQLLQTLKGHQGRVRDVQFSPDGEILASASDDNTVKLWDQQGNLLKTLIPPANDPKHRVLSVSFSPDGTTLAVASSDQTIKLWNRQGTLIQTLRGHHSWVRSVSFSPDGQWIASASSDKSIKLWDRRGQLRQTLVGHSGEVLYVGFSPDGETIASASSDNTMKLWDLQGNLIETLAGHRGWVWSVSFSPDGQTVASASSRNTVSLWQRQENLTQTLKGHRHSVLSISFSPDGSLLASSSDDKTVKLWDRQGNLVQTLAGHRGGISSVRFSPDGQLLASASDDKTVKLWDRQGTLIQTLKGHQSGVWSVSFSPDGQLLASASDDNTVKLWDRQGNIIQTIRDPESRVLSVSFSPNGDTIAAANDEKTVKLWDLQGNLVRILDGHHDWVRSVSFSPDGETIASASDDNMVHLWDPEGNLMQTLEDHRGGVWSVRFSPDGETIASASDDKTVKLWDRQGNLILTLKGHRSRVLAVDFNSERQMLASASGKTVKLWHLNLGDLKRLLQQGCNWLQDYLNTNPNVSDEQRALCAEEVADNG